MIAVRQLEDRDIDVVHAINEANVPEVGTIGRQRLAELVEMSVCSLVATTDPHDRPVGFCVVFAPGAAYGSVNYRWFMDRYDDACYLDRVAIADGHRRLGLAGRLYDEVEHRLRRDHDWARRLTLEVNVEPPNEPSMAFHLRRGFREVGRQRTPAGTEVALLVTPLPTHL